MLTAANQTAPRKGAQRHGRTACSGGRARPCRWHGRTVGDFATAADALSALSYG